MRPHGSDLGGAAGTASRRGRLVGAVAAAMLVAAAGGVGFGIGRSVGDDGDAVLTPAAEEPAAVNTETPPATDPPATTAAVEPPVVTDAAAGSDGAGSDGAAPESGSEIEVAGDVPADVAASGGSGWSPYGGQPMELLFERTTADGVTVRAHLGELWYDEVGEDAAVGPMDGWQPPPWCYESGQVRISLAGGGAIDVGSVSWYTEPYRGRSISWLTLGRVDGAPHRVVFVQAPADTTTVTATFGDGAVDSVAPEDGVAVLVVPGEPPTIVHTEGDVEWYEEQPDFDVTFEGGSEPATVAGGAVGTWGDPEFEASCSPPPPALPEPGEQPADPAAARVEITDLMAAMYGAGALLDHLDRIDDPSGVESAAERVGEGSFQEEAASAQAIVEELVFTDPATAWFRYRIDTSGLQLRDRFGIAVLVDGTWKITRATICQDLSLAGGSCGAGVEVIRPPTADPDDG